MSARTNASQNQIGDLDFMEVTLSRALSKRSASLRARGRPAPFAMGGPGAGLGAGRYDASGLTMLGRLPQVQRGYPRVGISTYWRMASERPKLRAVAQRRSWLLSFQAISSRPERLRGSGSRGSFF